MPKCTTTTIIVGRTTVGCVYFTGRKWSLSPRDAQAFARRGCSNLALAAATSTPAPFTVSKVRAIHVHA